ncbi:MAG: OmpA family protein [Planctomycetaceae bacterium]|nr:OmpA family protein [Planctomycetaceae bacterium]
MSTRTISLAVVSALGLFFAVGCDVQGKDKQIGVLTRDRAELVRQKEELTKELETARAQYAKATEAIDAKEVELKAARARVIELEASVGKPAATYAGDVTDRTYREPASGGSRARSSRNGRQVIGEVAGDVLFGPGKATLSTTRSAELDRIVATLKSKHAGARVQVIGHSDGDPISKSKWKDNYELSNARAQAVKQYLVSHGIVATSVETQGVGFDRPLVSPEKSKADKARNRRVEIAIQ